MDPPVQHLTASQKVERPDGPDVELDDVGHAALNCGRGRGLSCHPLVTGSDNMG